MNEVYEAEGLRAHEGKARRLESEAQAWGSKVEGLRGEVGVAREKVLVIATLTTGLSELGVVTPHLCEKLAGAWCHVAVAGQRSLLSLEKIYTEPSMPAYTTKNHFRILQ